MGKAIGLVPGKSEEYLLLEFEVNCRLWLRGNNDEPVAYADGFITVTKDNAGTAGLKTYLFRLPDLIDE